MTTTKNLELIINKVEAVYAEAAVFYQDIAEKIDKVRTDLYWAYREALERGE